MSKIKAPKSTEIVKRICKPSFVKSNNGIRFSFENLNKTEFFNLDGTCPNWSLDLFDMMKIVSSTSRTDLIQNKYKTYRVHPHTEARPPSQIPEGITLRDLYQIRISASKGGIHGVFVEDIFYVIWFDPLHNLYPDDRFGGLRKVSPASTCCKDRDLELLSLKDENKKLNEENKKLKEEIKNTNLYWESEFEKIKE